jgi:hypothetical protein
MRALVLTCVAALASARFARAEPVVQPRAPHVIHVPTAWVLARDTAWGSAGADHRGGGFLDVVASLAGLAEIDAGVDDAFVSCTCVTGRALTPAWVDVAGFKLGVARGGDGRRAGIAIGARRSFDAKLPVAVASIYLAGSVELGPLRAHAGVTAWGAEGGGVRMTETPIRPFAGLEWTPAQYPRTAVIGDFSWLPELEAQGARVRWIAGWGVRYQALSWGSIELTVRHREGDELGTSTVMVRVNGFFSNAW